jgi:hypothetical protein
MNSKQDAANKLIDTQPQPKIAVSAAMQCGAE